MTKTQRELLILVGILVVIAVILFLRLGGGGDAPPAPIANTPAAQRVTPGADDPQTLLITQAPAEMLNPMLADSAVTARITAGAIMDPFASVRLTSSQTSSRQTTRQPEPVRSAPSLREIPLSDWPEGLKYDGLVSRAGVPGEYSVLFNDQPVQVGGKIPGTQWNNTEGTEWVLREANRLVIVIQREVHTDRIWEVTTYRHVIRPSVERER
ncbi:hypothetical protein ACFL3H_00130 [Gemmatimonadota bacterium]